MVMRRLNSIALGLALLASFSLHAQMRGSMGGGRSFSGGSHTSSGFRSSGPSRSFAGPARGFTSGPRAFAPAPRSFGTAPRTFAPRTSAPRTFASRSFAPRTFSTARSFSPVRRSFVTFPGRGPGFHRFHHRFFHDRFFFRGCFGCFSPFFFNSGFFFGDPFLFDPFYAGYPGYGYPPPPPAPVYVNSDSGNDAALAAEVQRLTDEVDDLREEARDRDRSESRAAAPNTSITAKDPGMPVEFIFRDGRHISAQNYAIAGQTLWIMDEHAARKFALSDLDIDATQQSNAAKGIDLHIPAAHQ